MNKLLGLTMGLASVGALCVAGTVGCGAAVEYEEGGEGAALEGEFEEAETARSAIMNGNVGGGRGAVELRLRDGGLCTGTVISPNAVVTASHCFQGVTGAAEFTTPVSINYTEDGRNWQCLTGGGSGRCPSLTDVRVKRMGSLRETNENDDFAVIVYRPGFGSFDDWRGLQTTASKNMPYLQYGAVLKDHDGAYDGLMRFLNDNADEVKSRALVTHSARAKTCGGDSGGPYLGHQKLYVVGVHSSSQKWLGNECTRDSYLFLPALRKANRITESHIPFINEFIDKTMGSTSHYTCEKERDGFYWCAPPRPATPLPSCEHRCVDQCGNLITSAGEDFGFDVCVASCPAQCGN